MSQSLRLAALANSQITLIRNGFCEDEAAAASQLLHLSLRAKRCCQDPTIPNPLRLLPYHVQRVSRESKMQGQSSDGSGSDSDDVPPQTQLDRLTSLADHLGELCINQLLLVKTRRAALELCKLFRLGEEGMRVWSNGRKRKSASGGPSATLVSHKKASKTTAGAAPSKRSPGGANRKQTRFAVTRDPSPLSKNAVYPSTAVISRVQASPVGPAASEAQPAMKWGSAVRSAYQQGPSKPLEPAQQQLRRGLGNMALRSSY